MNLLLTLTQQISTVTVVYSFIFLLYIYLAPSSTLGSKGYSQLGFANGIQRFSSDTDTAQFPLLRRCKHWGLNFPINTIFLLRGPQPCHAAVRQPRTLCNNISNSLHLTCPETQEHECTSFWAKRHRLTLFVCYIRFKSLWRWCISTKIKVLNIIHRLVFI
jgi:hypothetical protein